MYEEVFEYRRQARGPGNYLALGVVMMVLFLGWAQGWGLSAIVLCGPFLGMVLVRLVLNEAQGFRMNGDGIVWYGGARNRTLSWHDLDAVTIAGDGAGGAECLMHIDGGETARLPATSGFAPERLALEFRQRGVPVWRPAPERLAVGPAQLQ